VNGFDFTKKLHCAEIVLLLLFIDLRVQYTTRAHIHTYIYL